MSNIQTYSKALVYLNGDLLSEESNVTVKRESGGNAVKTVAKGYSGRSPGAPMTTISVTNAVPSNDFEKDPGAFMLQNEPVEVTIFAAGRTLICQGFIIDDNFQHGVENAASLEFNFEGGASMWQ